AVPDPDLVEAFDVMLTNIPEGYGVTTDEKLNAALVENPDMQLIDVRRVEELQENGVIDSGEVVQTHIPLEDFITMKDKWPADVETDVTVYCGSGHRSTMAMTMLWTYLYNNALSLKGGFGNWLREGYPVLEYAAP
ncbi:unnamed protein product, partial [marine sediment metagenome]